MQAATSENVDKAILYITAKLKQQLQSPSIGIICGSGLGGLSELVEASSSCEISYNTIPSFPTSTIPGHAGKLVFGTVMPCVKPIVFMVGRTHYYEGHDMSQITFPIRVLKRLGVEILIVTNAAGGLNPAYNAGDFVLFEDHLSLASLSGLNPLRGANVDEFGPRFQAMSDAYDLDLRRRVHRTWLQLRHQPGFNRNLHEGVYAFVGGPSYETRAECRMLRQLGADTVGMSTVPEVIVARHCSLRIVAISLVTNKALLDRGPSGHDLNIQKSPRDDLLKVSAEGKANHDEVIEASNEASSCLQHLIWQVVQELESD